MHLLGFRQPLVLVFTQRQKDTVDQDGKNDEIVEELIGGDVNAGATNEVPRSQAEQGARGVEAEYRLLLHLPGDDDKTLKTHTQKTALNYEYAMEICKKSVGVFAKPRVLRANI